MTSRQRPRWDPDDRRIGVADARGQLDVIDALRRAADEDGWVAEEPELHLLPHLLAHAGDGLPDDTMFASHGHTLRLRLTGPEPAATTADSDD